MENRKVLTAILVIIMILLALNVASRLFVHEPTVEAENKLEYKVVSFTKDVRTAEGYEGLLNEMANKGWTFDHVTMMTPSGAAVFRR